MRTSIRTIMNARARQRKSSLAVQGFKCHEIGHKRYLKSKSMLEEICKSKDHQELEVELSGLAKRLKKEVEEYEKKNNINQKPVKPKVERRGFAGKVRSLFSRRKK